MTPKAQNADPRSFNLALDKYAQKHADYLRDCKFGPDEVLTRSWLAERHQNSPEFWDILANSWTRPGIRVSGETSGLPPP